MTSTEDQLKILKRGTIEIISEKELSAKLDAAKKKSDLFE